MFCQTLRAAAQGKTAVRGASRPAPRHGERNGFHGALPHDPRIARALAAPPRPPCPRVHLAEVLKLRDFGFYQSISNFVVSLPNVKEKDVKGLLFRKQQRISSAVPPAPPTPRCPSTHPSSCRNIETADFQLFTKYFKFYCQLTELK